ncbi:MAG: site-specific integrase [Planctomycetota bacterium]
MKDGREVIDWQASWYGETGRRRTRTIGRVGEMRQRDAKAECVLLEVRFKQEPVLRTPERAPNLGAALDRFLVTKEEQREGTVIAYKHLQRLLVGFFGAHRMLRDISTEDLAEFRRAIRSGRLQQKINQRKGRPAHAPADATVSRHMRHARAFFRFVASHSEYGVKENPFNGIKIGGTAPRQWDRVPLSDFWKLYRVAPGGWGVMLSLCRLAALRRSDALALTWSGVDLESGLIKINAMVKTGRELVVPIRSELREILLAAQAARVEPADLVVPQRKPGARRRGNGRSRGLVYVGNIGRDVGRMCDLAGIPRYSEPCHALRKSCIDDWAREFPPSMVQAWAGHSSLETTMKHYSKVQEADHRRVQSMRDDAFFDTLQSVEGGEPDAKR